MQCNTAKLNHHRLSNSGVTGRGWFRLPGSDRFIKTRAFRVKGAPPQELPSHKDNFSRSSQLFSAQDSIHGFVTPLQNGIFSFPSTMEIFIDVEYYLENNISFIFHDFVKKL